MAKSLSKPRLAAFKRQQGLCHYCKAPMWLKDPAGFSSRHGITERQASRFQCTGEHLQARQDGGSDKADNIVAACRFCNMTRHHRASALDPGTYRNLVQRRLRSGQWHPRDISQAIAQSRNVVPTIRPD